MVLHLKITLENILKYTVVNCIPYTSHYTQGICDALRDLVPFAPFKKREKHPLRSVIFSKVAG